MRRYPFGVPCRGFAFTAVVVSLLIIPIPALATPAFDVHSDAFSISNAPGWCFAMVAFSRWYFLTHPGEPPLRQVVSTRMQQRIAKELQEFYSRNLIGAQAEYCNRFHAKAESYWRFAAGLTAGEPRIVLLMNKGPKGAILHAVLAYAWDPKSNMISIYDPNYTAEERYIDLERNEYTSLDVTYNAICFPEVLDTHRGLVKKMETLYDQHVNGRTRLAAAHGPVADPMMVRAAARASRLEAKRNPSRNP